MNNSVKRPETHIPLQCPRTWVFRYQILIFNPSAWQTRAAKWAELRHASYHLTLLTEWHCLDARPYYITVSMRKIYRTSTYKHNTEHVRWNCHRRTTGNQLGAFKNYKCVTSKIWSSEVVHVVLVGGKYVSWPAVTNGPTFHCLSDIWVWRAAVKW
jgi:hypothetical protein